MPIQVNPVSIQGLASLAGNQVPHLGLEVADLGAYGKNYAQAVMANAQLKEQYAGLLNQKQIFNQNNQTELQRQQMSDQTQYGTEALRGQNQSDLEQARQQFQGGQNAQDRALTAQQLAQSGQYQQGMLGIDRQNANTNALQAQNQGQYQQGMLGIDTQNSNLQRFRDINDAKYQQQEAATKQAQVQLLAYSKLSEEDRKTRAGAASLGLAAFNSIPPDQLASQLPKLLDSYLAEGIITPAEHKQFDGLSPAQIHDIFVHDLLMVNKAEDVSKNPVLSNALGLAVNGVSTQQAKTKSQEQQLNNTDILANANKMQDLIKNNPDVFTTAGGASAHAGQVASRNPILSSIINGAFSLIGHDPQKDVQAKEAIDQTNAAIFASMAKDMSPRLLSRKTELQQALMPSTDTQGAPEALQKTQNLIHLYTQKQAIQQQFTKNGTISDISGYQNAVDALISKAAAGNDVSNNSEGSSTKSLTYNGRPIKPDQVEHIISATMAVHPELSRQQILAHLGA